jgi:Tfp pilus assembly protein PilF
MNKVSGGSWQFWALAALLVVVAIAVEWPALHGVYQWDDDAHIWANPNLRDTAGLVRTWTNPRSNLQYYPLTITGFWIESRLWGLDGLAGYHFVNMLLHGLNCVLVWLVLRKLGVGWAWLAALLFAIHPMVVDSVAWISELKNMLSGGFYLLALLAWLKWSDTTGDRQWYWYAAILVAFVAGILSKAVVCTFPVAVLLIDYWRAGSITRRAIFATLPMFAIGVIMGLIFAYVEKVNVGAKGAGFDFTIADRILIAGRATIFYLTKLVWPMELLTIYPRWHIDASQWWQWIFPIAALAIFVVLWAYRKRITRGPFVAFAVYVVSLAPALGFVNFYPMRLSFVADHYAYLAMIPILALAAEFLRRAIPIIRFSRSAVRQVIVALAFCFALIPLTAAQASLWRTPLSLWAHTVEHNPDDWTAQADVAWGYFSEGNLDQAKSHAEKSLAISPGFSRAHYTLGMIYLQQGHATEAVREFATALEKEKFSALFWEQYGTALEQAGKLDEAEHAYRMAAGIDPTRVRSFNNLASIFLRRQQWAMAEEAAREAVRHSPQYGLAHVNLGFALDKQGKYAEAAAELNIGLQLVPENPRVRLELARMLKRSGDVAGAIAQYRQVVAEMPQDAAAKAELDAMLDVLQRGK